MPKNPTMTPIVIKATKSAKGDLIWLSIPTAGKLSSRWEGGWKIDEVKSPVTMKIANIQRFKVASTCESLEAQNSRRGECKQ